MNRRRFIASAIPLIAYLSAGCSLLNHGIAQRQKSETYQNPHGKTGLDFHHEKLEFELLGDFFTRDNVSYFVERDPFEQSHIGFILRKADETGFTLDRRDMTFSLDSPIYFARGAKNSDGKIVEGVTLSKEGSEGITAKLNLISKKGDNYFNFGSRAEISLSNPLHKYAIDSDGDGKNPAIAYFAPLRKGGDLPFCFLPDTINTIFKINPSGQLSIIPGVVYEWRRATECEMRSFNKEIEKRKLENKPKVGDTTSDVIKLNQ